MSSSCVNKQMGYAERKIIEKMCNSYSMVEIGKRVHKSDSAVWRELNRCGGRLGYTAKQGQMDSLRLKEKGNDGRTHNQQTPARMARKRVLGCLMMNAEATLEEIAFVTGLDLEKVKCYYKGAKAKLEVEFEEERYDEEEVEF